MCSHVRQNHSVCRCPQSHGLVPTDTFPGRVCPFAQCVGATSFHLPRPLGTMSPTVTPGQYALLPTRQPTRIRIQSMAITSACCCGSDSVADAAPSPVAISQLWPIELTSTSWPMTHAASRSGWC